MNEDKNINVEIIANQIKQRILEKTTSRQNPFLGNSEEIQRYLDEFKKKMEKLLPENKK